MKNKKTVASIASLLILIFHLWIYVISKPFELYLRLLFVVGVDIFFFISAYNIGGKNIDYKKFIRNRFFNVYVKFILFSLVMFFISSWGIGKLIYTILGINLFINGGGSFLWFIPGIMILYLLLPLYKKIEEKKPILVSILFIVIYLTISILVSLFSNYNDMFILTNRIPIILIGYYVSKYKVIDKLYNKKILYWTIDILLLIGGFILSYVSIKNNLLVSWLYDLMYLVNIPFILGLIMLLINIPENRLFKLIGSSTIEIYALQMMFGFKLVNSIYLKLNNAIITNVLMILIFVTLSIIFSYIFKVIYKFLGSKLSLE